MNASERARLIAEYRAGHAEVIAALEGVNDAELDRQPADGGWTAREIAHHLADSETTSYIRLRRLLAEDQPVIMGYDENEFARRLHYDRPINISLEVFRLVRDASAELLERLTEDEWARTGSHSEDGAYGVERWLEIYARHGQDHARQIRNALGRSG